MAKYLDPKADLTFKKVFAEHKDLMISFLNAMLPLSNDGQITSIEYIPVELVPKTPLLKDTIVDVSCKDQQGRSFIVEMQMIWQSEFLKRVLFNSSKSYVRQLAKGETFANLQPVYSLNLVNDVFRNDTDDYYYDYGIMDVKYHDQVIEDMHLVFIELPKFKPHNYKDKKMMVLWLRFLTEINEKTKKAPEELLENSETRKALDLVEESAYDDKQMNSYDHFWDVVSTERTYIYSALKHGEEKGEAKGIAKGIAEGRAKGIAEGRAKGIAEGRAKGIAEGRAEGAKQTNIANARKMKSLNVDTETIVKVTGLTKDEVEKL